MTTRPASAALLLLIVFAGARGAAAEVGWAGLDLPTWPAPVAPEAIVTDGVTDLRWVPQPYVFAPGPSIRYIDYESGDDAANGSKAAPWKHHPWDPAATGQAAAASGVHSYVFKGGVIYRGHLVADESGSAAEPIRLLRDPSWGEGPATIAGSVALGGWQRVTPEAASAAGIPAAAAAQLWVATVPGEGIPRALWRLQSDGARERLTLARWPNWRIEHRYDHFTQWFRIDEHHFRFPWITLRSDALKGADPQALAGVTVWADHPNTSGEFSIYGPFPSRMKGFDPADGSFELQLQHPARHPRQGSPFFLENSPAFLDEAGEWWFDQETRRLYAWLPDAADPTTSTLEAALHEIILDIQGQRHIAVGGLTFTGGNISDPRKSPDVEDYHAAAFTDLNTAIRLLGDCRHIELHHLRVVDSAGTAVSNLITAAEDLVRDITVRDSEFLRLDTQGVDFKRGYGYRRVESHPKARLTDVHILRNRFEDIGFRSNTSGSGNGVNLYGPEVADIAGNTMLRTTGQGINVVGGRPGAAWMGGNAPDTPLVRIQIRHNKVVDSLLYRTDFGGIEFWGNGPAYISNNISANPVGFVAHRKVYHKNEAYYMDHGIKAFVFNNVGWSERFDEAYKGIIGDAFINGIRNRFNQVFHNTGYCFRQGIRHSSRHGDQEHQLANLLVDMHFSALSHWTLDDAAELAFGHNLIHGATENVYSRWRGASYRTPADFDGHIATLENQLSPSFGWWTDDMPIRDGEGRDFRPTDDSAAIDRGVRVFVPWALSGEVGEWHFRKHPADPQTVLAYDLYMQRQYLSQTPHIGGAIPLNHLEASGYTTADYVAGPLEDWVDGAIVLDGRRVLRLPHDRLIADWSFSDRQDEVVQVAGAERQTLRLERGNFLIEAVLRAEADGVIAGKLGAEAGYALELQDGRPLLRVRGAGSEATLQAGSAISDGRWHHLLAEVDRSAGTVTLYLDGRVVASSRSGQLPPAEASLDNASDFVVGDGFAGALDYLRIARGTLADAQTTIDELMAWQFNGPHLHDWAGRAPVGLARDVGALEHPTASGRKPIRYTPPATEDAEQDSEAGAAGVAFKDGPDRRVTVFDWGSISVPKTVAAGESIDFQVVFGTETVAKQQQLVVDIHGWKHGKRVTGAGQNHRKPSVVPGVTTPYATTVKMPEREQGFEKVSLVFSLSPDGSWSRKTLSGEVSVDYPTEAE